MKTITISSAPASVEEKECATCLFDSSMAAIHEDEICEYCKLQETLHNQALEPFDNVLKRIKGSGKYDCLIGISGGEDSSILLYLALSRWHLNTLVIHFDNRSNRPEANYNIELLTSKLGVNFIRYYTNQLEYDRLTDSFLKAGLPDADIPNDIAMAKLMYETAKSHGIKYILNGHDYRREGSSPSKWSYMDAKYVESVYKRHNGGLKLHHYPLYTFWDQIWSGIIGIKQIRPYHYSDFNRGQILQELKDMGWKDYGGKHNENVYTAFVGNYLLPRKFKIDKRRTYLSAQIREGMISKEYAKEILQTPAYFNLDDLGSRKEHILRLSDLKFGHRNSYERYNFKKWRPIVWVLAKLKIVPFTFLHKYCR